MTKFEYTDSAEPDSSVIGNLYYNENTAELAVVLHSGVISGYYDVPVEVWREFKRYPSTGEYWNRFIKPHMTGFDTGYIDEFVDLKATAAPAKTPEPVESADDKLVDFSVETHEGIDISVKATGWSDLLDRYRQIAAVAGWEETEPVAIYRP